LQVAELTLEVCRVPWDGGGFIKQPFWYAKTSTSRGEWVKCEISLFFIVRLFQPLILPLSGILACQRGIGKKTFCTQTAILVMVVKFADY
jgi:hypothetical protein